MIQKIDGPEARSASEIMAEARVLQSRHAPRVLGAVVRALRTCFVGSADKPRPREGRQIIVH